MKYSNYPEKLIKKTISVINEPILHRSLLYTFVIGLAAHGYAFLNLSICGDSLVEFYMNPDIIRHKIALGRFLVPVYSILTCGKIILPWSLGLMSLLWIGLSVYIVNSIFSITNKWSILAVAGVMTVNQCLISLFSTYIHDSGADTFSLFCSVLAFYYWVKASITHSWRKALLGVCFMFTSLALYQAYISVTFTLLIIYLIRCILLENISCSTIFKKGLWYVFLIAISGGLYFICSKGIMAITGSTYHIEKYNSIEHITTIHSRFISSLTEAYLTPFKYFFQPNYSIWPMWIICMINCILLLVMVFMLVNILYHFRYKIHGFHYFSIIGIVLCLPLLANLSHLLSGRSHDLMHYGFNLLGIIPILLFNILHKESILTNSRILKVCIMTLYFLLVFSNIQTANAIYVKKNFEREHAVFEMSKLISFVEQKDDYKYGVTPIAFVGKVPGSCVPGTDRICSIHGCEMNTPIDYYESIKDYFRVFLQYEINLCDKATMEKISKSEEFKERPSYPNKNSIFFLDDILIVKF